MYPYLKRIFWSLLLLLPFSRLSAQCDPDVTPPTAVCTEFVYVSLNSQGTLQGPAHVYDQGSFDECCLDTILIRRLVDGPCDADTLQDDFSGHVDFCCGDIGQPVIIVLRAVDCAGNWTECWVETEVEDKVNATVAAPVDVVLSNTAFAALNINLTDTAQMNAVFGAPTAVDNCGAPQVAHSVQTTSGACGDPSAITRTFTAADPSGNTNTASQTIRILDEYVLHLPVNFYPNDPELDSLVVESGNGAVDKFYQDAQFTASCFGAQNRTIRSWTTIDWCGANPDAPPLLLPQLDLNGDGIPGDAYSVEVQADSVFLLENGAPTIALGPRTDIMEYRQTIRQNPADTLHNGVYGNVFIDNSGNCALDPGEQPFINGKVRITGLVTGDTYEVMPELTGAYYQPICPEDTLVEISLDLAWNYGQGCPMAYLVPVNSSQPTIQDISVGLTGDCPLLTIDLSTSFLRRCFFNTYTVQVCNLSDETIPDVHAEIRLDNYFQFSGGSIPSAFIGDNTYSFDLGNMAPGACMPFELYFNISCDAPFEYTHCSSASVFPYSVCDPPPAWTGANVEVEALCDGDSVRLSIRNSGNGNMAQALDFVVVEDVIMFQSGSFQLNSSMEQQLAVPANGATWRIEAQQEINHPWGGVAATALEGCGGLNTPGLVTLFPLNSPNPFHTRDCRQNIGSFDPNDKQGFPRGYGDEHFVKANTDLEYLIRFQNTGTDTAFTVVVLDTLSPLIDPNSVRPGATSHPCDFAVLDGNVMRFRFDNIMLPDSNVNEPVSHGFIKFRVAQVPDLADGSRIENSAAIYFDFNDPVITNTTFHTIGDHFILVNNDVAPEGLPPLRVYPNPAADAVSFEIPLPVSSNALFELRDAVGRLAVRESFAGTQYRFERKGLSAGIYVFQLVTENGRWAGKLLLK